jgi:hypothetical protein
MIIPVRGCEPVTSLDCIPPDHLPFWQRAWFYLRELWWEHGWWGLAKLFVSAVLFVVVVISAWWYSRHAGGVEAGDEPGGSGWGAW